MRLKYIGFTKEVFLRVGRVKTYISVVPGDILNASDYPKNIIDGLLATKKFQVIKTRTKKIETKEEND